MTSKDISFSVCLYPDSNLDNPKRFFETAFPYTMRAKDYFVERPDDSTVVIDWQTQECDNDDGLAQFKAEAERWAKENGIIGSGITVKFKLSTRGDVPWKSKFEVK